MYTTPKQPLLKPFFEIYSFDQLDENFDATDDCPHVHPFIEMIWVVRGKGTLKIDLQTYSLSGQQVYCILPSQVHQLSREAGTEGYVIRFNELFLQMEKLPFNATYHEGLTQVLAQPVHTLHDEEGGQEMLNIIRQLMQEQAARHQYSSDILVRYLDILIMYLARQAPEATENGLSFYNTRLAKQFNQLVDKHFLTHKRVTDYAELIRVTPGYLSQAIKKTTCYPAQHHIMQRVALEARRRAVYSDCSMKEIAWDLGFSSMAHFSRFFKKATGNNFSDFKRKQVHADAAFAAA
jgi:AraC-like DNA-binding protein